MTCEKVRDDQKKVVWFFTLKTNVANKLIVIATVVWVTGFVSFVYFLVLFVATCENVRDGFVCRGFLFVFPQLFKHLLNLK
jgi:hypothetical protein